MTPLWAPKVFTKVFTKVLKPAIKPLRTIGIGLVVYMDNMLLMTNSEHLIQERTYIYSSILPEEPGSTTRNLY